ncbi:carbamoyl-phosphate synthase (glutamine-hydrolyzing) large subunit [Bacteroidetes bacterium endosymbiont of Geopemphigus sp.]|uniref:carbamoyl-phosphate synthase (glutamine-hydrolyzing) large subunit n=1 Tax=Bacteroidetes bacterium endosymbiont of Geopemphigus sp. TaxID=2047937 RepID=UPI000CD10EFD|nr:carbamoyl-phosphate synthase (glutamine-hydrolyzing) large subunit [Bacteroidetes bacterium endosymbiont of Geopemphigus sp.]
MKKVIIIGSGALKIGEAGEFDYSGTQALKALKEEGIETVLVNPNIATVQTSEGVADKIYFLPILPEFIEKVIQKEKPQGILLAFGGQSALNCGVALFKSGVFKKYGLKVLGTSVESIIASEDRDIFRARLDSLQIKTARSRAVRSIQDAFVAAQEIGFPLIIRAAYALGGLGSGFAGNQKELKELAEKALVHSSQILIEESLKGWKEIEYEVVRDCYDNCITVCNMENFDPIGIHTGESIVVAPSQTLTNSEYQKLRGLSMAIARSFSITGECNVQFALSTDSEDYRVIEINARLSRSSALASKATGYPLAFIAAKLALGYGLHELKNTVNQTTSAFFEPALDYVVCKLPRWDLKKFYGVSNKIGSSMKSVGEVMAIGGSFEEALQKGLRMLDIGLEGFTHLKGRKSLEKEMLEERLQKPTDRRIEALEEAFDEHYTVEKLYELTRIDPWFLCKLRNIHQTKELLSQYTTSAQIPRELLYLAKKQGFSDLQIAQILNSQDNSKSMAHLLRLQRKALGILPYVRQIDTLAAEYPAKTNYLYMTYHASRHDINYEKDGQSVVVLGSGVYRIGSSVEFDWCCVNALKTLRKEDYRSVMINCNPETVSTDFDECDRLYFEEISLERVLDILELEDPKGTIVSMGGQIPNSLALKLHKNDQRLLGSSALSIDGVEDRYKFSKVLDELRIRQPRWRELSTIDAICDFIDQVGYPVLIRPSYVLSGAAMNVVSHSEELAHYLKEAVALSLEHPVVVSEFIENAKEIELDAVAYQGEILYHAISEHVEFAGVHSGDATLVYPPQNIYLSTLKQVERTARKIAKHFEISGPFNIQFLSKNNRLQVIECNLRASRSFPFVSKVSGFNMIQLATEVMLGKIPYEQRESDFFTLNHIGIKASQFSFSRLQGADPVLGVDMASTGEVGTMGKNFDEALIKSMLAVGYVLPEKNILISGGPLSSKLDLLEAVKLLSAKDYCLFATEGTHEFLKKHNVPSVYLNWPDRECSPNVLDYIRQRKLDLIINIPKNLSKSELDNDYTIRRAAVDFNIPLLTNARLARAFVRAFCEGASENLAITEWKDYFLENLNE